MNAIVLVIFNAQLNTYCFIIHIFQQKINPRFVLIFFNSFLLNSFFFNSFFSVPENVEEQLKRQKIEAALTDPNTPLSKWQEFAKSDYGLVSG